MSYCEDYPCCGHTSQDPCDRQWYDEPGAFDNPHALCEHEFGICEVNDYDDEPEDDSWDDADSLVSIGWGTDEDYGYFGD